VVLGGCFFLIDYIKMICSGFLDNLDFSDVVLGEVLSVSPVSIRVSDKLVLNENQVVLSDKVTDYVVEITENPLCPENPSNDSDFKRRKKYILYNGLKVGESVIMIKAFGGQMYFVIDRTARGTNKTKGANKV